MRQQVGSMHREDKIASRAWLTRVAAATLTAACMTVTPASVARAGDEATALRGSTAADSSSTTLTTTGYPGGKWSPGPPRYGAERSTIRIKLQDGITLTATLNYPTSLTTGKRAGGTFPVIIHDDPYADGDLLGPDSYFVKRGYIFVNVRPRGTSTSTGSEDLAGLGSQRDGRQVVKWASTKLSGSNGKVGLYGVSYTGLHALTDAAAAADESGLKAVVAIGAAASPGYFSHESMFRGGILSPFAAQAGLYATATGGQQGSIDLWNGLQDSFLAAGERAYVSHYWKNREPQEAAKKISRSGVATLLWTGWKDETEASALQQLTGQQNVTQGRSAIAQMHRGQKTSAKHQIIVGDTGHGEGYDSAVVLQWFDTWLKEVDTSLARTKAPFHLQDTGTGEWVNTVRYPQVSRYTTYHLTQAGGLATTKVRRGSLPVIWGKPEDDGTSLEFTTRPLKKGATLAGPISAVIEASSSNTNMELEATLSDIAPDGSSTDISAWNPVLGSQRQLDADMTWKDSTGKTIRPWTIQDKDRYLVAGQTYRLAINMEPRLRTIKPGHSLRLTIATRVPFTAACEGQATDHPCYYSASQDRTLPGGNYSIKFGDGQDSHLNVPLAPIDCFRAVRSGTTPTSTSSVPLDWSTTSRCARS